MCCDLRVKGIFYWVGLDLEVNVFFIVFTFLLFMKIKFDFLTNPTDVAENRSLRSKISKC